MAKTSQHQHIDLQEIARQVMRARGFDPDFPPQVRRQVKGLKAHASRVSPNVDIQDLRKLPWSSIDNDTSRDLDQIEVAERSRNGDVKVRVAIADLDVFVGKETPIDAYAGFETTTVYAGVTNFPMLPEELCYDASSLVENADRFAIVTEFVVRSDGTLRSGDIYRAIVRNHAQLTYVAVGRWLEGKGPVPPKASSPAIQAQLKLQDAVAQKLKQRRYEQGALYVESIEISPVFQRNKIVDIVNQEKSRATDLIEDFMIAANGVVARRLEGVSSIRRVVKTPQRWDRIVSLAAANGSKLPAAPSSKALNQFLLKRKAADPDHFADLSLAVIKLIGRGEYVLEQKGGKRQGHFGLAVQDYAHSTAPNRRFADMVTQRLIKAMLAGNPAPYTDSELAAIAQDCTLKEDQANRVERDMSKRIAAVAMSRRIGEVFSAVVTGVKPQGTFVRILHPHVEGMLVQGGARLDVGDRLQVKLVHTDIARGYIDFAAV
ncbi:RNB domain-containing ribonuclease [Patescibacteria group bacterium]|nr:RNB domain-containing ribonuclease [Patescibacteria group bacterium]